MSAQIEIYARYAEKETRGKAPVLIANRAEVAAAMQGATHISGTRKGYTSGQFEGTYRLEDGRIAEKWLSFGWITRLMVWPDQAAYNAYSRPMPRDVYFNG
jgi:hypothetical protein